MAEPSTHINYSFEDIQRYLQGKMPAAEMHAIEKAALQDPFLADAIEGYTDVKPIVAQQHLNEINTALIGKKEESKVVAFNKKTQWLNVAAVVIVLAGIGVVASYFLQSSNKKTQVAKVESEPAKNQVLKDSLTDNINTLSKKPDTSLLIAENKSLKKTEPLSRKKVVEKDVINNKTLEEDKAEVASVSAAPVQFNRSNETSVMDSVTYNLKSARVNTADAVLQGKVSSLSVLPSTFSGKVVDENNKPVPFVTIESADKKTSVFANANGDFSIQKNDTLLNVTASTVGYDSKAANLKTGNNNIIKLRSTTSGLNEVVVVGYGTEKKRNFNGDSIVRSQRKMPADSAQPIGGWQNFNNYVLSSLNKDTTAQSVTNANDFVEIEFLVDKLGTPYNFNIITPSDEQKKAKAIEILKNGPKWTNTSKKKKAKVSISF